MSASDNAHRDLDAAVAAAYGWPADISVEVSGAADRSLRVVPRHLSMNCSGVISAFVLRPGNPFYNSESGHFGLSPPVVVI